MRTKILLLAAAATVAGIAASQAQSNVYSQNVVGYYNIVVPGWNGTPAQNLQRYKLAAVQLKNGTITSPTLNNTLTNVPTGLFAHVWTTSWSGQIEFLGAPDYWDSDGPLPYGAGIMLKNGTANPMTVTVVGEVMQGALTSSWPGQLYSPRGSLVPQAGLITTDLNFTDVGAAIHSWNNPTPGWSQLNELFAVGPADWEFGERTLAVGEAVMIKKIGGSSWNRNFTVQ